MRSSLRGDPGVSTQLCRTICRDPAGHPGPNRFGDRLGLIEAEALGRELVRHRQPFESGMRHAGKMTPVTCRFKRPDLWTRCPEAASLPDRTERGKADDAVESRSGSPVPLAVRHPLASDKSFRIERLASPLRNPRDKGRSWGILMSRPLSSPLLLPGCRFEAALHPSIADARQHPFPAASWSSEGSPGGTSLPKARNARLNSCPVRFPACAGP